MELLDKLFYSNIILLVSIIIAAAFEDKIKNSKWVNLYVGIIVWTVPGFLVWKIFNS